jgi:hypothetical protein
VPRTPTKILNNTAPTGIEAGDDSAHVAHARTGSAGPSPPVDVPVLVMGLRQDGRRPRRSDPAPQSQVDRTTRVTPPSRQWTRPAFWNTGRREVPMSACSPSTCVRGASLSPAAAGVSRWQAVTPPEGTVSRRASTLNDRRRGSARCRRHCIGGLMVGCAAAQPDGPHRHRRRISCSSEALRRPATLGARRATSLPRPGRGRSSVQLTTGWASGAGPPRVVGPVLLASALPQCSTSPVRHIATGGAQD